MNLRDLSDWLKKQGRKLYDNKGYFQRGQFTPVQGVVQDVKRAVQSPTVQQTVRYAQTPIRQFNQNIISTRNPQSVNNKLGSFLTNVGQFGADKIGTPVASTLINKARYYGKGRFIPEANRNRMIWGGVNPGTAPKNRWFDTKSYPLTPSQQKEQFNMYLNSAVGMFSGGDLGSGKKILAAMKSKTPASAKEMISNLTKDVVKNSEETLLSRTNLKTGERKIFTIPKGQLKKFRDIVDNAGPEGIGHQDMGGYSFALTDTGGSKGLMGNIKRFLGAEYKYGGVADLNKLPKKVTAENSVETIINALKGAKTVRGQQENIYTKIRSKKASEIGSIGKTVSGEAGYQAQLSALKGEMPKVTFKSIRKQVTQPVIDDLFNQVEKSNLAPFEKITAKNGLSKLLGAEGGTVPTEGQLKLLNQVFPPEFTQAVLQKRPLMEKLWLETQGALNLPRSVMASVDYSAPLRQGVFVLPKQFITHPIRTTKTLVQMFKASMSEKEFGKMMQSIKDTPTYQLKVDNKLALTDLGTSLSTREEAFMSKLAEKIPLVKPSARAYTGFLNKLRSDLFDDLYNTAVREGKVANNAKLVSDIANFVNTSTGRGSLPTMFERMAPTLNAAFFSPRLMASRVNLLNPVYYAKLDPFVRKEAIKNLVSVVGTGLSVLTLAKLNGLEVGTNPTSADFGKIKTGTTRYDIWGGFQQYVKLFAQLATGKLTSTTTGLTYDLNEEGKYRPITRMDIIARFFAQKQAPIVSFAAMLLSGETQMGEKPNYPAEVANRFIPMVIADMYDLYRDGGLNNTILGTPAIFGVGLQTYGEKQATMGQTPSGKPKIEFSNPPGLGEVIGNKIAGTKVPEVLSNSKELYESYKNKLVEGAKKEDLKKQTLSTGGTVSGNLATLITDTGVKVYDLSKEKEAVSYEKAKLLQSEEPYSQYKNFIFIKKPNGTINTVDTSFQPTPPVTTGNYELDKKAISKYKGQLTSKANDIYDLYKAGIITADQAEEELSKLKKTYSRYSGRYARIKKPKAVTVKKVGRVGVSQTANIGSKKLPKLKMAKSPVLKPYKSKKLKVGKVKLTSGKVDATIKIAKLPKLRIIA